MVLRQTVPLLPGLWSLVRIKESILKSFEKIQIKKQINK